MIPILLLLGLPSLLVSIDFVGYLSTKKRMYPPLVNRVLEWITMIGLPLLFLLVVNQDMNECCMDSATFSPEHILTIYCLVGVCVIAYFISTYKKSIISPITETLLNSILLGGVVFNIFIAIQVEQPLWLFGNLPIILLFLLQLIKNQEKLAEYSSHFDVSALNRIELLAWKILNSKLIFKTPILLILCLPLLTLISSALMLFGQKPDSLIRAFTDTYKHGFSQLDHLCENVQCGEHFLCSVAANGHSTIVQPHRLGLRGGAKIMCNRQLLVANAFEELIQDKLPQTHQLIRRNYNKVGNLIHRYYGIFNLKIVADLVYIIMKPLEWFFLLVLYSFEQNPENRIAKQYLSPSDRMEIEKNKRT